MTWSKLLLILMLAFGLPDAAYPEVASLRILVMGDSLMAVNRVLGGSVGQALGQTLGAQVQDRSVPGARYFFPVPVLGGAGLKIRAQIMDGPWDYVVMNGGGNDLLFGCGCGTCTRTMNKLVTADGTAGAIPDLVAQLRLGGAKVIYTGYLRTPGVQSPVESCGPIGDELDRRLMLIAERDKGFQFLLLSDLVTKDGDRSYHGIDMVHPSIKGSRAIADRVADLIRE